MKCPECHIDLCDHETKYLCHACGFFVPKETVGTWLQCSVCGEAYPFDYLECGCDNEDCDDDQCPQLICNSCAMKRLKERLEQIQPKKGKDRKRRRHGNLYRKKPL